MPDTVESGRQIASREVVCDELYKWLNQRVDKNVVEATLDVFGWDVSRTLPFLEQIASYDNNSNGSDVTLVDSGVSSDSFTPIQNNLNATNQNYDAPSTTTLAYSQVASGAIPKTQKNNYKPSPKNGPTSKKKSRAQAKKNYDVIRATERDVGHRIVNYVKEGIKVLVLMRGCPGSGKSSYACHLLGRAGVHSSLFNLYMFSTDNYFGRGSDYVFRPDELSLAHEWNQDLVYRVMSCGQTPVIVDNTNTQMWEMRAYAEMGVRFGYAIEIVEPPSPWFSNDEILATKNTHGVPRDKIRLMLSRYEKGITPGLLLNTFRLSYNPAQSPPQLSDDKLDLVQEIVSKADEVCSFGRRRNIFALSSLNRPTQEPQVPDLIDFDSPSDVRQEIKPFQQTITNSLQQKQARNEPIHDMLPKTQNSDANTSVSNISNDQTSQVNNMNRISSSNSLVDIKDTTPGKISLSTMMPIPNHSESSEFHSSNILFSPAIEPDVIDSLSESINNIPTPVSSAIDDAKPNFTLKPEWSQTIDQLYLLFPDLDQSKLESVVCKSNGDINLCITWLLDGEPIEDAPSHDIGLLSQPGAGDKCEGSGPVDDWGEPKEPVSESCSDPKPQRSHKAKRKEVTVVDNWCNTNYSDFALLKNGHSGLMQEKVLIGNSNFVSGPEVERKVKQIATVERGTMTTEVESSTGAFSKMSAMFPGVDRTSLAELYERCQGDMDWAVGLLLDEGHEATFEAEPEAEAEPSSSEPPTTTISPPTFTHFFERLTSLFPQLNRASATELYKQFGGDIDSAVGSLIDGGENFSEPPNDPSPETQDIIDHIKNMMVMNEESYPEHVLKIKKAKYGLIESEMETLSATSPEPNLSDDPSSPVSDLDDDMNLQIDKSLIVQLQEKFGGLVPVEVLNETHSVPIPTHLARQLYSYIIDAVFKNTEEEEAHMDLIIEQDEQLDDKSLPESELAVSSVNSYPSSLREIMDGELALSLSKSEMGQNNNKGKLIASRLSFQLLTERYPKMDPSALSTLLQDSNHSLDQATKLLISAGHSPIEPVTQTNDEPAEDSFSSAKEAVEFSKEYRVKAADLYVLRKSFINKAVRAYQNGDKSVASYYSQMAHWQSRQIEEATRIVATSMISCPQLVTTIDLHFMASKEATQLLDVILDEHIRVLRAEVLKGRRPKREIYIITGRGMHSVHGKSVIKPLVQRILKKRQIQFLPENPGMLVATLNRHSLLSYESFNEK